MSELPLVAFDAPEPANAVQRTYETVVSAVLAGQRGIGVLAAEPGDVSLLFRTIPSSKRLAKFRFLRFTPASPAQLTLQNIAFQAGLDVPDGEIDAAAMFDTLQAHQPASGQTVLIVEGAETLTAEALEFFEHAATPSPSPMQLVLIGRSFASILAREGELPHLWAIVQDAVAIPRAPPSPVQSPAAGDASCAGTAPFPAYVVKRPQVPVARKVGLAVAIMAAGAALYATPWFNQTPPHDPPLPATVASMAAVPVPPKLAEPAQPVPAPPPPEMRVEPPQRAETPVVLPAAPPQAPADETRQLLRQRFDAFLDQAGRDAALMTYEQRNALFEKYLASHSSVSAAP